MSTDDLPDAIRRRLAELREISESTDDHELLTAFAAVTELEGQMRVFSSEAADLRALLASRIRDVRGLSLAALAEATGVNRARAGQWVDRARKQQGQQGRGYDGERTTDDGDGGGVAARG